MRSLVVSLLVHALAMLLAASDSEAPRMVGWTPPRFVVPHPPSRVMQVEMIVDDRPAMTNGGGGRRGGAPRGPAVHVAITGFDRGEAAGTGRGTGTGIGFGTGGGIAAAASVPAPPEPEPPPVVKVSKARPAKLVFPTRDRAVEDPADLFIARVTVDTDGDVVGARMVKTRPGSRGDQAADAIWTFRYLPALNDEGLPVRSTFEQPFQIR